jgi:DNA-binding MarR family transcriptional regulator
MATGSAIESLERLAQEIFEVVRQLSLATSRGRRRPGDLKEGEFLTLSLLQERGTTIVGDLQRELGVLPAQMSRIIRGLEDRGRPLITCQINPQDKRKVNVNLTAEGERALSDYRRHRIGRLMQVLRELDEDHLDNLAALVERIRASLRRPAAESRA